MDFNKQQLEAINTIEGTVQVIANAGSGKSSSLVERICNMIENYNVPSKEILAISFTNASASDLKSKLANKGIEITVGTFHSICRQLLQEYDENKYGNLLNLPNKYQLKRELEKITKEKNLNVDDILSWIGYQKAYNLTSTDEFEYKESLYEESELRVYYKIYEDFCRVRKVLDFDSWMLEVHKLYKSKKLTKKWKYVLADEAQDTSVIQHMLIEDFCSTNNKFIVGDVNQCWEEHGTVRTSNGIKLIRNIEVGDMVECNNGGIVCYKPVTNITKKKANKVVTVTTKKGKSITTTLNHKFFVKDPLFAEKVVFLYLMYRSDKGFRIGLCFGKTIKNRIILEHPDRFWIVERYTDMKEAYYDEEYYSMKYSIPKIPFHNYERDMIMEQNGLQMLKDLDIDFKYPNYTAQSSVQLKHITQIGESTCKNYSVEIMRDGEVNNKEYFYSFKDAYTYAQQSERGISNSFVYETLGIGYISKSPYKVVNVANATVDMETIISDGKVFSSDDIVKKEVKEGKFIVYDIEVAESGTMVVNDILTHNCIYEFRAAYPKMFKDFDKKNKDTKVINMYMNYRSKNNIVEAANNFIRPYNKDYDNYKDSEAFNKEDGIIECKCYSSAVAEALNVINKIEELHNQGVNLNEMAIVYRNNAMADYVENELKKRKIEYQISSNSSFFDRKEIKGILSVLRLVVDSNDDEAFEILVKETRLYPCTYFQGTLVDDLKTEAGKKDCSLFEAFMDHRWRKDWEHKNADMLVDFINRLKIQNEKHLSNNKIIDNVVKMFKVKNWLLEKATAITLQDKLDGISNLKNISMNSNLEGFVKYCNTGGMNKPKKDGDFVSLLTVHKSKGLEYKVVFLISLQEDKFPSNKSSLESEARLMYVACTRAKDQLYVSCVEGSDFYTEYKLGVDKLSK